MPPKKKKSAKKGKKKGGKDGELTADDKLKLKTAEIGCPDGKNAWEKRIFRYIKRRKFASLQQSCGSWRNRIELFSPPCVEDYESRPTNRLPH